MLLIAFIIFKVYSLLNVRTSLISFLVCFGMLLLLFTIVMDMSNYIAHSMLMLGGGAEDRVARVVQWLLFIWILMKEIEKMLKIYRTSAKIE